MYNLFQILTRILLTRLNGFIIFTVLNLICGLYLDKKIATDPLSPHI